MRKKMHLIPRLLLLAAAWLVAGTSTQAAVVTNWAAFNDHVPGPLPSPGVNSGWGTAANANRYNLRGIAGTPPEATAGVLKDYATGLDTPASIIVTATGSPDYFGSIQYPGGGTPGSNLFNGIVDLGNPNSAIGIRSSANSTVTLTFSNLNPALLYKFRGTVARGNNYTRRWTLVSIRGAASYMDAHTTGVFTRLNFPTGTMTNGQAAYNSGENRANGALVGWDDIAPDANGMFTIKCEQYVDNPLPNALTPDLTTYGYAFAGIWLAEVGAPVPVSITVQPPAAVNLEQNRTLALSVTALGAPAPSYQWYKDNVAIPGATSRNFSKPLAQSTDSGNYLVTAGNALNSVTSSVSVVTVTNDVTPPVIVSAASIDGTNVQICFSEQIDPSTAIETGSYALDATIATATLRPDGRSVVLVLSTPVGENFTIGAFVSDLALNSMDGTLSIGTVVHLTPFDVGSPIAAGNTFSCDANLIELTAGGADLWTTSDQGHLALASRAGDFDVRVRVVGLTISDNVAKAGLMVRESSAADSRTIHILANPTPPGRNLIEMGTRATNASVTTTLGSTFSPAAIPNAWLRLRRFDQTFSGYRSTDGVTWTLMSQTTQTYPETVLVGLAATAHNNGAAPTLASFLSYGNFGYAGAAIGITQQPVSTTIPANNSGSVSLTATATNAPASELGYRWQTEANIGANDWTNIAGANGSSLPLGPVSPADDGRHFRALVSLPGALSVTSSVATLTVVTDTFPPRLAAVRGGRFLDTIKVTFNERMNAGSATTTANYTLTDAGSNPVTLGAATLSADEMTVTIATAPQTPGGFYTLGVSGVTDIAGNPIVATNVTFQVWVVSRGFVLFEAFDTGAGTAVSMLTSHPSFPNSPSTVAYIQSFDSRTIYPDDSHDNYGARISGYYTAPASSNYIFYLRSDDASELWLSTNSSPTNRVKVQEELGCCTLFSAHGTTSAPPALVSGQRYFLEVFYKEGGGGDYGQVAVKTVGDPTNPDTLTGIRGTFLSALADPIGAGITIVQQPASTNIQPGQTASFAVRATGTNVNGAAPVGYQWQRFITGVWQDIAGATSSNYVTATLAAVDTGAQYRTLILIPGSSTNSAAATVTVGNPVPTLRYGNSGGTLTLSWDAPARLQCTTSLTPPIVWQDVTTTGETSYTVNQSNQFNVNLDTAQAGGGGRTGTGSGTISVSNNILSVDVVYSGLSGNRGADHFHAPAARGFSAGVVYDLGAISTGTTSGTIKGNVTLVNGQYGGKSIAAQVQDMRNSLWYLNLHTSAFGGGEIRGQVEPGGARFYRLISP